MNQLLERNNALEEVSNDQQQWIKKLKSDKTIQQCQINKLESRMDALKSENTNKRQVTAANTLVTKKIRTVTIDLSCFGKNIVIHIVSYLNVIDLANLWRTCGRFGLTLDDQQRYKCLKVLSPMKK